MGFGHLTDVIVNYINICSTRDLLYNRDKELFANYVTYRFYSRLHTAVTSVITCIVGVNY